MLGLLILLNQLPHGLGNSYLVRLILLCLRSKAVPSGRVRKVANLSLTKLLSRATFESLISALDSIHDDAPDVFARSRGCAAQSSARARPCRLALALVGSFTSHSMGLQGRHSSAPQPSTLGEETLARVALHEETLLLVSELIPQRVERGVVRAMDIVAELMQHGVNHVVHGHELITVTRVSQAETYLPAHIHVETYLR